MKEIKILSNDKQGIYSELLPQCESLIKEERELVSLLANFTAILKQTFDSFSWVGFYLIKNGRLILGPFQGKVACSVIEIGKGVCGTSVQKGETIIIEDVDEFPGHIACDSGSRSEIVIPIFSNNKIFGVLDIDSYKYSNFDSVDKANLENLCYILSERISKLDNSKV
ncbi:MAG: GAF domain-containing protein [Bacteroidetes bacterium]|nr:GAF domain-containing protein [Bacteroidota bacterium]MBU2585264.1 GAF domain-containing protein [Bacteroidota bacterium]